MGRPRKWDNDRDRRRHWWVNNVFRSLRPAGEAGKLKPHEVERIQRMRAGGMPLHKIAEATGIGYNTVRRRTRGFGPS